MASIPAPPYQGVDWNDEWEKTPLAIEALKLGQLRVERWLNEKARERTLDLEVFRGLHRAFFGGAFPDFAGCLRGPEPPHIPTNRTFGAFRGVIFEQVPNACSRLFEHIDVLIRQLDDSRQKDDANSFTHNFLKFAAFAHCEIVRIHPFCNGNGRISRVCVNYFSARYGMTRLATDRPGAGSDYLEANRAWLERRDIEPFVEFLRPLLRPTLSGCD